MLKVAVGTDGAVVLDMVDTDVVATKELEEEEEEVETDEELPIEVHLLEEARVGLVLKESVTTFVLVFVAAERKEDSKVAEIVLK